MNLSFVRCRLHRSLVRLLNRNLLLTLVVVLSAGQIGREQTAIAQSGIQVPLFQVDPMWPKPLPNHWVIGKGIGVAVDSRDHIWMVHRPSTLSEREIQATLKPPVAECCVPAPPVLEFDQAGNLLRHWGGAGPGYEWPQAEHGIYIDHKENVWLGGNGAKDAQILKFTQDGKFLLQIGHQGKSGGSNDTENLGSPANVHVDPATNELYVADGYRNRRVIVFDADTGKYKRHWGAYGNRPDDTNAGRYNPDDPPAKQFRTPVHCVVLSNDGLVYVCDRANDRIQVFNKDGTFVKEAFVARTSGGYGTTFDIGFSRDAQQRFLYVPDAPSHKVHILLRDSLQVVSSFGDGGRQPGQFDVLHSQAVDSKGNIYTGETEEGKRVQRFLYKGMGPASSQSRAQ